MVVDWFLFIAVVVNCLVLADLQTPLLFGFPRRQLLGGGRLDERFGVGCREIGITRSLGKLGLVRVLPRQVFVRLHKFTNLLAFNQRGRFLMFRRRWQAQLHPLTFHKILEVSLSHLC